jgi:hypothetical protein
MPSVVRTLVNACARQRLVVIAHSPFIFILKLISGRATKTPPRRLGERHEPYSHTSMALLLP